MENKFADVDNVDSAACIAFLDFVSTLEEARSFKQRNLAHLDIGDGDTILDVGCGTGEDATSFARHVGRGCVVAIDLSHAMIAEARVRTADLGLPLTFQQADACRLPFADGTFSRVHIDRVLHVMPDPTAALREAARVLVRGGRIVVSEPDWNTLRVDGADEQHGNAMNTFFASLEKESTGAALNRSFSDLGLEVISDQEHAIALTDCRLASTAFDLRALAGRAVAAQVLNKAEAFQWLNALQVAEWQSSFRASLSGHSIVGVKAG